jgi:hypothetical protein
VGVAIAVEDAEMLEAVVVVPMPYHTVDHPGPATQ